MALACPITRKERMRMDEKAESELRAIQKKSMEILMVFQDFCEKHNLLFYFCGGCCIGAARHHGFIPWDDDIDVFMPRQDYETLAQLWPKEMAGTKYRFCRTTEREFTRYLMAAISDETTTFIKARQQDLDTSHGVRLDIIPLDGCPTSKWRRICQIGWALIRQIYINQEPLTSGGKLACCVSKLMLWLFPSWKLRYRIAMFAEKRMTRYPFGASDKVTELCARFAPMLREYPLSAFVRATYLPFEDGKMPVPVGYDTYLTMAFGDYMQLPPEDAQIPKHETVLIDLEHSYKIYKGTFYCKKQQISKE